MLHERTDICNVYNPSVPSTQGEMSSISVPDKSWYPFSSPVAESGVLSLTISDSETDWFVLLNDKNSKCQLEDNQQMLTMMLPMSRPSLN